MATLKAIRKRISSIRNTQQITKAMKMVSAAKLRRAQEAAVQARPYADKMAELLRNVAARVSQEAHPLLNARDTVKIESPACNTNRTHTVPGPTTKNPKHSAARMTSAPTMSACRFIRSASTPAIGTKKK